MGIWSVLKDFRFEPWTLQPSLGLHGYHHKPLWRLTHGLLPVSLSVSWKEEFNLKRGCECLHTHKYIRRIPADPATLSLLQQAPSLPLITHTLVYTKLYHMSFVVGVPRQLVTFDPCPCGLIPSVYLPYSVSISSAILDYFNTRFLLVWALGTLTQGQNDSCLCCSFILYSHFVPRHFTVLMSITLVSRVHLHLNFQHLTDALMQKCFV